MNRIWRLAKQHPIEGILFLLAVVMVGFFTIRLLLFTIYWSDPSHRNIALEPWMTPRYAAYSWRIPKEDMQALIGKDLIPLGLTLGEIADEKGITLQDLEDQIRALSPLDHGEK
ncbi:hypothetical protein [Aliiroseovarius lamellibrachiae]|uniref:hypothetical protein n=1 Tax=Aliiroseovarius lamellibrachiae TaxID=1924933 RepID=UPI001BE0C631|nr:hypothetical protein [Aliiroseovarius lamellibrachiae]MBT2131965.1 hypothetical protein [Aliiroseovarius lamellibrachiae]